MLIQLVVFLFKSKKKKSIRLNNPLESMTICKNIMAIQTNNHYHIPQWTNLEDKWKLSTRVVHKNRQARHWFNSVNLYCTLTSKVRIYNSSVRCRAVLNLIYPGTIIFGIIIMLPPQWRHAVFWLTRVTQMKAFIAKVETFWKWQILWHYVYLIMEYCQCHYLDLNHKIATF